MGYPKDWAAFRLLGLIAHVCLGVCVWTYALSHLYIAFEFSRSETDHLLFLRTIRFWPSYLYQHISALLLSLFHLHLKALYFLWARNCCPEMDTQMRLKLSSSNRGNMAMGTPACLWTAPWILHFNLLKHFKAEEARFKGLALPRQSSGRIFNIILNLSMHIISESMNHGWCCFGGFFNPS